VFNTFTAEDRDGQSTGAAVRPHAETEAAHPPDPTTIKPHETNPFSGE
jgi:hypothetical protein